MLKFSKLDRATVVGSLVIVIGSFALIVAIAFMIADRSNDSNLEVSKWLGIGGLLLVAIGAYTVLGVRVGSIEIMDWLKLRFEVVSERKQNVLLNAPMRQRGELDEKKVYAENNLARSLLEVDEFNLFHDAPDLAILPTSDPLRPMYMLDSSFRVLDWNEAFSLAFDYTLEGMRGAPILDWVYNLENWKDVIDRGNKEFGDQSNLPAFQQEEVIFYSNQYGRFKADKRAYKIPSKDKKCYAGWLVILDPRFEDDDVEHTFRSDLFALLTGEHIWSQYSLCYDRVLNKTQLYKQLVDQMLGIEVDGVSSPEPIPPGKIVLDLGSGTGNIAIRLREVVPSTRVYAFEKNMTMFRILEQKLQNRSSVLGYNHETKCGIVPVKQDISILAGVPDSSCDYVLMNNVLYSVVDPESCLREAFRVLKPGGEIRISGPRKDTKLSRLLKLLEAEIRLVKRELSEEASNQLDNDFRQVEIINKYWLSPMLFKWSPDDLSSLTTAAGFMEPHYKDSYAYGGEAMIQCSMKPVETT